MADANRGTGASGNLIAFIVGGLLVLVAVIGFVVWNGGQAAKQAADTVVDVDVTLPSLPDAPKLPDTPTLPPVEPPTLPSPGPQPAN